LISVAAPGTSRSASHGRGCQRTRGAHGRGKCLLDDKEEVWTLAGFGGNSNSEVSGGLKRRGDRCWSSSHARSRPLRPPGFWVTAASLTDDTSPPFDERRTAVSFCLLFCHRSQRLARGGKSGAQMKGTASDRRLHLTTRPEDKPVRRYFCLSEHFVLLSFTIRSSPNSGRLSVSGRAGHETLALGDGT
jgi:hypothetical protein